MDEISNSGNIPPSSPPIRGASCSPPSLRSGGCSYHPSRAPSPPRGLAPKHTQPLTPFAPVIRGHMCLVCCTRPIASIAYFTPGNLGTFRMSARAKKGCGVADLVPSPATPQPFSAYRAAILHYPDAFRSIRS